MKTSKQRTKARLVAIVAAMSLVAATAWSQSTDKPPIGTAQASSSSATANQGGRVDDSTDDRPQHIPDYTGTTPGSRFSQLLLSEQSPLHWGHLNVLSFSFMQSYQNDTETSNNNSILRGDLNYSISKAGMDFAVGYSPSVWFSQNGVHSNFSDHRLSLATHRKWGRWVFGATDSFYSLPLQSQFSQFGYVDTNTYGRNMDPSLIAGNVLSNQVQVTADRLLGPSDRVEFNLGYMYNQVSNANNGGVVIPDSTQNTANAGLSWNHTLGWRSSINLGYTYTRSYYDLIEGFSQHHSVVGTYSVQPKRGWDISLSFGPTYWRAPQQQSQTTYLANVAVTKKFSRSSISLTGGRTDQFVGIIGDTITNTAGVTFDYAVTRKWHVTGGGNYIRAVAGLSSHSWRAWNQTSYSIARNWSLFVGYSFFQQTIVSPVNPLPSHFASAGIRWSWSPEQR